MSDAAPLRPAAPEHRRYLIWLAGFLDGRGYIGCVLSNKHYIPRLKVVDRDPTLLNEIQQFTGYGGVRQDTKTAWAWTVSGVHVMTVLRQVEPFIRARRAHVETLLSFPVTGERGADVTPQTQRQREEIYERLKLLNK